MRTPLTKILMLEIDDNFSVTNNDGDELLGLIKNLAHFLKTPSFRCRYQLR
ncbi:hypothetical protein LCO01nite_08990 [Lapidilactobacillus concavus]|nr:hypothetical protein LCO01nite_08990 [Lapidilactobacillus concavus]